MRSSSTRSTLKQSLLPDIDEHDASPMITPTITPMPSQLSHDPTSVVYDKDTTSAITFRSIVLGAIFAAINSTVNMFFNFRYAGGLGQYWVIIVSYVVLSWMSKLEHSLVFRPGFPPSIRIAKTPPLPFTIKEHTLVTVCGAAAAFSQSLGLSGGLAPLTIYYGRTYTISALYLWTFIAGFFGVFLGLLLGPLILYDDKFPWPIAEMNAQTIQAFHGAPAIDTALRVSRISHAQARISADIEGTDVLDPGGDPEISDLQNIAQYAQKRALRIFAIFAVPTLLWYCLANSVFPFLVSFPVLCWICKSKVCQVVGNGFVGIGFPGVSLGPSVILGGNNAIISFETSCWLITGAAFSFWILSPALYYSGTVIWPGGLNLFQEDGSVYTTKSTGQPYLSSTMWLTVMGLCFVLVGQSVTTFDEFGVPACRRLWSRVQAWRRGEGWSRRSPLDSTSRLQSSKKQETPKYGAVGGVPVIIPAVMLTGLAIAFVIVISVLDLGLPVWASIFTILLAMAMSLALGMLMGTSGQNMAFPSSLLTQLLFGFMLPGDARANIAASAINNAITAQSLTLFNDYRTALLCGVRPRDMMLMQVWGTAVGLVCSVLVYDDVMSKWASGTIVFDVGVWANLGASGAHVNGEIFGRFGIISILKQHSGLMAFACVCFVLGVVMPIVRKRIPEKWRPFCPDIVLLGVSQFSSSSAFSIVSNFVLAWVYQIHLKFKKPAWYSEFQMVSVSGMNMGVGLGGLVLLVLTNYHYSVVQLGGPANDGCFFPKDMPQA